MAPSATPGRKKPRENQYWNIGQQGRRTGVTLQPREKDEHGMEAIEGMFSSPEKSSPRKPSPRRKAPVDTTLTTSEDMVVDESRLT